ncbi:hypothetical protein C8J57DRAFT_1581897 [Mycena rebaudengoi]|nr:hypothetical protein C8J57DRAFT_1581897 [Mycena rebaudengoi]
MATSMSLPSFSEMFSHHLQTTSQPQIHPEPQGDWNIYSSTLQNSPSYASTSYNGPTQAPYAPKPTFSALRSSSFSWRNSPGDAHGHGVLNHVCPTCAKRFSRPSSLKTHLNSHSGECPFACPYPSCGRKFNVNSNMRRHFRSHSPATARTSTRQRNPGVAEGADALRSRSKSSTPSLSSTSGTTSPRSASPGPQFGFQLGLSFPASDERFLQFP